MHSGFGAFMKKPQQYRRRAIECAAFARNARSDEERMDFLIMAQILKRLALESERKNRKTRRAEELAADPR
jgi:hypothetical protein